MPLWTDVVIVTLAQAKQHARITSSTEDQLLEDTLIDAHALVLDYVERPSDADHTAGMLTWDDETAPRPVRAAILRTFADLARHRGNDDDPSELRVDGTSALSPRAKQLLRMYRDPALA
jgi:hypothetical protein